MNPTQNQPNEIQLPNETPMQIEPVKPETQPQPQNTETFANTSNISSIAPDTSNETTPVQPLNLNPQATQTVQSIKFDDATPTESAPDFSMSSSAGQVKNNSQKFILIIAGVLGVLIVFGSAYYFLKIRDANQDVSTTTPSEIATNTEEATTESQPALETEKPALSNEEYLAIITNIETSTLDVIKKTPINVNATNQATDQIRFASDTLFANYQTLSQTVAPDASTADHTKLTEGYKMLVESYDVVLKSLKENNKITEDAKKEFSKNYNASVVIINESLVNIKNPK